MSEGFDRQTARMRQEFDESFARAPEAPVRGAEQFLAIGAGGGRYALRLSQVALLAKLPKIISMPAAAEGFLGMAAVRTSVVPVFSIARLLGQAAEAATWLVVAARRAPRDAAVGFAFGEWDGYIREVQPEGRPADTVAHGGQTYVIIDLFAFQDALQRAAGKER